MVRWDRINRANHVIDLAVNDIPRCIISRKHRQAPYPVAVQPEILGAGVRDDHLGNPAGQVSNDIGVVIKTVGETLVSHIDERYEFTLHDNVGDRSPVGRRATGSGSVIVRSNAAVNKPLDVGERDSLGGRPCETRP